MAVYTTPRTWATGELVTAVMMNTHVRDNIAYLHGDSGAPTFASGIIIGDAGKGSMRAHRHPYAADRHIESGLAGPYSLAATGGTQTVAVTFTDAFASAPAVACGGRNDTDAGGNTVGGSDPAGCVTSAVGTTGMTLVVRNHSNVVCTCYGNWIAEGSD